MNENGWSKKEDWNYLSHVLLDVDVFVIIKSSNIWYDLWIQQEHDMELTYLNLI